MMSDLPDEVLRYILAQLSDHQDLVNAGLAGSRTFALCEENGFWRRLCAFHFTDAQWSTVLRSAEDVHSVGWKQLYGRLLRFTAILLCIGLARVGFLAFGFLVFFEKTLQQSGKVQNFGFFTVKIFFFNFVVFCFRELRKLSCFSN